MESKRLHFAEMGIILLVSGKKSLDIPVWEEQYLAAFPN